MNTRKHKAQHDEPETTEEALPEAAASYSLPDGLDAIDAKALHEANAGSAVNVGNPQAAIEFIMRGHANEGVIVCDKRGVQHWPAPPPAESGAGGAFTPGPEAKKVVKAPAIVGAPEAPAVPPKPEVPVQKPSTPARGAGKPPAA